jgi:hypothetical protein
MPIGPEHRLTEPAEFLFRQVTKPGWIQDGRPTSQLFEPRPIDKGCVSVDRESIIGSAEKSLENFIKNGFSAVSTWGVTVRQVNALQLEAYADPTKKNQAHALIDMSALSSEEQVEAATALAIQARNHGPLATRSALPITNLTTGAASPAAKMQASKTGQSSKIKADKKKP